MTVEPFDPDFTDIRTVLSNLTASITGVSCTPTYTQLSRIGQACVQRDRLEYPDRFGGVGWWNVVLCLGQDMAQAEAFFDAHVPQVVGAISEVLVVKSARINKLQLVDGTTVLAAFINGFREE